MIFVLGKRELLLKSEFYNPEYNWDYPLEELDYVINENADPDMVYLEGNVLTVVRPDDQPENRSLHGLTRTLLNNMIEGTTKGFERKLEVNGVGYRASKKGNDLLLNLGYSHPIEMAAPEGITFDVPNANEIIVKGIENTLH